jgi:L-ascorbate metabolism protein UlaG (beta-lactamase superfamily)
MNAMDITYLGHSCFRIRGREATIVTDPPVPTVGYKIGKPSADIVTVSHQHYDHNNVAAVSGNPKVVEGPGEYEIQGARITGIASFHDPEGGKLRGKNTMYVIEMDDIVVAHLGDLGIVPTSEQVDELGNIDVLMIPVGGNYTMNASQAAETVNLLEPKIVIPMHFKTPVSTVEVEPVDRFLREMGVKQIEPQPKLSINKSNLPAETTVIMLDYSK